MLLYNFFTENYNLEVDLLRNFVFTIKNIYLKKNCIFLNNALLDKEVVQFYYH